MTSRIDDAELCDIERENIIAPNELFVKARELFRNTNGFYVITVSAAGAISPHIYGRLLIHIYWQLIFV